MAFCSRFVLHVAQLSSKDEALKSIVYSYKHGFSGFAAKLTEPQAEELKSMLSPNQEKHTNKVCTLQCLLS